MTCRTLRACVARAGEPVRGRERREARAGSGQRPPPQHPVCAVPVWRAPDRVRRQVTHCPSWGLDRFGLGWPGYKREGGQPLPARTAEPGMDSGTDPCRGHRSTLRLA